MAEQSKQDRATQALEGDLEPSVETAEGVLGGRTATDVPRAKRRAKKQRATRKADAAAPTTPNLTSATTNKLTAK